MKVLKLLGMRIALNEEVCIQQEDGCKQQSLRASSLISSLRPF
jgi:hypothetical protein